MQITQKVLVVGPGSFIAQSWAKCSEGAIPSFLSHSALTVEAARKFDVVVNCSISPLLKREPYQEREDVDLRVARLAESLGKHFVMLSTRKVYRPSERAQLLHETSPLGPQDHYGQNKLHSESKIAQLMGERCTILRIANVYGYELGRRSFFGLAMTKLLQEKVISLDVSPFVERDFIAVERLVGLLSLICQSRPAGIFNVGSGVALPVGRIAQWLIEGYGSGGMVVTDMRERDGFVMDVKKIYQALRAVPQVNNFAEHIKDIGKRLTHE